jgi:predicted ATPase/class 3 adenylate cyclase/tetratricopeptide (TPR) repeat protein/DNA-binding XRE family transcriptional regulator
MNTPPLFGSTLKAYRKAVDLTQEQLAEKVSCSIETIKKIEASKLRPGKQLAELLTVHLAVPAEEREMFLRAARTARCDSQQPRAPAGQPAEPMPPSHNVAPSASVCHTALPKGTVTFLFTDIEGSTQLWEHDPQAMNDALTRHDALLCAIVEAHHGIVFKLVGDSVHAVFTRASDALVAALAAQRAVAKELWGRPYPLRVRMALHTGCADERDRDYFGPSLNRLARLLAAGHGGQILLSRATTELVADSLPSDVKLRDLGVYRLRNLTRPEHLFQVVAPDLPCDFPLLRGLGAHPNNIPVQSAPLIGREREMAAIVALLRQSDVRLLTLSGPGGTGKTRLALQVATELLDSFADGVYFVDLAPISDSSLVISAITQAIGLTEQGGQSLLEQLHTYLRDKQLLLVLDNFEQIVDAAPQLAELLATAPQLNVLVTSRMPLHLRGEQEYRVAPLALPDLRQLPPSEALTQYPAVALFIQRVRNVTPGFHVTDATAAVIAEICCRLDGLPLAIELAAAWIKLFPPQALLGRLGKRLAVLTGGARDLPARQRTLRDTIAWSYHLLDVSEQQLFRRLAVFAGGCTLEAIVAVCAGDGHFAMNVVDGVFSLVDKSLLRRAEDVDGEPRFVMLETIREYALETLLEHEEIVMVRQRHMCFFLNLAETAEPELHGANQRTWLKRLDREHDNMRSALGWSLEARDFRREGVDVGDSSDLSHHANDTTELGLRLAGALCWFWLLHGYYTEGRRWLHGVSTGVNQAPTALRAKVCSGEGTLAFAQGDCDQAAVFHEHALALYQELDNQHGIAFALNNLGAQAGQKGDMSRAALFYTQSLTLSQAIGNRWLMAFALNNLGDVAREQGDVDQAVARYQESLALCRELGDQWIITVLLHNLGEVMQDQGKNEEAMSLYEESLALSREWGYKWVSAYTFGKLGQIALVLGDIARARTYCQESIMLVWDMGLKRGIAEGLEGFAALAYAIGAYERAAHLYGAAESVRESSGAPIWPADRPAYDCAVAAVRAHLNEQIFATSWAEGQTMTIQQSIAGALNENDTLDRWPTQAYWDTTAIRVKSSHFSCSSDHDFALVDRRAAA